MWATASSLLIQKLGLLNRQTLPSPTHTCIELLRMEPNAWYMLRCCLTSKPRPHSHTDELRPVLYHWAILLALFLYVFGLF